MKKKLSSNPVKMSLTPHEYFAAQGIVPVYIDYEFNRSNHPAVNPVSCSLMVGDGAPVEYWLHNRPDTQDKLKRDLLDLHEKGAVFVGYAIAAEGRAAESLGLDPHTLRWVDLYAEWMQLTHNNHSCEYGTIFSETGYTGFSVPPSFDKNRNKGKNNNRVGHSMVAAVGQLFGVFIDSIRKKEMRNLIIADKPTYSPAEQSDIMAYCSSDIIYLPALYHEMTKRLSYLTEMDTKTILRVQLRRGSYSISIGKMESEGFPVLVDKIKNLRRNYELAEDTLITDVVENHYPFWVREKKRNSDLFGSWTDKYLNFEEFVKREGLFEKWPRTVNTDGVTTTTLSREDKVLATYEGVPQLRAYRQAKKQILQIRWFRQPDETKVKKEGDFFDSVGPDNRLRTFLGPFGTQTGRNAPKASRFILAMSSWLRCLISPPPGYTIIGIDWASQEFAIAAILSGDTVMMEAYKSGDPYLYFAKKAGAVPWDAEPEGCKDPEKGKIYTIEEYVKFKFQRGLFKSTTLGLQYGMGAEKLAVKLSSDMGVKFTVAEAEKLIALHKKIYAIMWRWAEKIGLEYDRKGFLLLWDGWALLPDNDNTLSVKNFPTQGGAGVVMREAVRLAHEQKIRILSPLHDAIYCIEKDEKAKETAEKLAACMDQAVLNVLGDALKIRLDIDFHDSDHVWIEDKGKKYYQLLSKYLEYLPTTDDRKNHLLSTIYR